MTNMECVDKQQAQPSLVHPQLSNIDRRRIVIDDVPQLFTLLAAMDRQISDRLLTFFVSSSVIHSSSVASIRLSLPSTIRLKNWPLRHEVC